MMQFFPPSLALTLIRILPYVWKFIRCMFSGVRHWVGVWRWTSPTLFTSAGEREREREREGGGGGTTAKGRERGEIIASQRHFPNFYTKQAFKTWRSPLHAVFHWNGQGKTRKKKSERTPPVSWRPWTLAYSRDRPYNCSVTFFSLCLRWSLVVLAIRLALSFHFDKHKCASASMRARIRTCMRTHTHTHTHARTHARTHTHARMHAHKHTNTNHRHPCSGDLSLTASQRRSSVVLLQQSLSTAAQSEKNNKTCSLKRQGA